MVMAEAAALSQLDMSNLNNRQQAAVQNAQSFLQMDMANLSNEQQTACLLIKLLLTLLHNLMLQVRIRLISSFHLWLIRLLSLMQLKQMQ
jgi:hypothetical protein